VEGWGVERFDSRQRQVVLAPAGGPGLVVVHAGRGEEDGRIGFLRAQRRESLAHLAAEVEVPRPEADRDDLDLRAEHLEKRELDLEGVLARVRRRVALQRRSELGE